MFAERAILKKGPILCRLASSNSAVSGVLRSIVGDKNVSTNETVCEHHDHDESYHRHGRPSVVVWPTSVQEVSEVAKACFAHKMCMTPYGTGTGLEGGVAPLSESVCVNLTKMDQIREISAEDFYATVEPGVTRLALNYELRNTGLWFPVDPGADASLCGMAATSASGTNAVRYGTMKENIRNLEVVLADGSILNTGGGRRCHKSAAGYNLTDLFVGSEGTLGFITSVTTRLHAMPECVLSAVCSFPTVSDAVNSSTQILSSCIPIARIEYLDELCVDASNKYSNLSNKVAPSLFLEFHGTESSTSEQVELTSEIVKENGGSDLKWAEKQEERNHLWKARHDILYALTALRPGSKAYSTDVCVPVSSLAEAVLYSSKLMSESGIVSGVLGHVGDGNFHCLMAIDADNDEELKQVKLVTDAIARKGIELRGTCTGEHGIGIGKREHLASEMGVTGISVMKMIKTAIDPLNLMNPGKVLL